MVPKQAVEEVEQRLLVFPHQLRECISAAGNEFHHQAFVVPYLHRQSRPRANRAVSLILTQCSGAGSQESMKNDTTSPLFVKARLL
jgi:hypothetical protein